jgi:hypothetical protein
VCLAEERQHGVGQWEAERATLEETLRWDYSLQEQQKTNRNSDRFPPLERPALLKREVEAL